MDTVFTLSSSQTSFDQQLGFVAQSVAIDNPTNQWIYLDAINISIPPFQVGAIYPIPATSRAKASFTQPASVLATAQITGQAATLRFFDLRMPAQAGQAALGGRAPYQDRNPLTVILDYFNTLAAPSALIIRNSYTCPAGRRAKLTGHRLMTESFGGYTPAIVFIETRISIYPNGGLTGAIVADSFLLATQTYGTRSDSAGPLEIFIGATDQVTIETVDQGAGGSSYHYSVLEIQEFDA